MKSTTFATVRALVEQDPLTPKQITVLTGGDDVIDSATAAQMLGISVITLRRISRTVLPRINTTRYLRYRRSDVLKYREYRTG